MQLTVTPKIEGILKIVGVRWKLSGLVVGVYNFDSDMMRKRVAKGKRKSKKSMKDNLKFLVIKVSLFTFLWNMVCFSCVNSTELDISLTLLFIMFRPTTCSVFRVYPG